MEMFYNENKQSNTVPLLSNNSFLKSFTKSQGMNCVRVHKSQFYGKILLTEIHVRNALK